MDTRRSLVAGWRPRVDKPLERIVVSREDQMGIRSCKPFWSDPQMQWFGVPLRSCVHDAFRRIDNVLNWGLPAAALTWNCAVSNDLRNQAITLIVV